MGPWVPVPSPVCTPRRTISKAMPPTLPVPKIKDRGCHAAEVVGSAVGSAPRAPPRIVSSDLDHSRPPIYGILVSLEPLGCLRFIQSGTCPPHFSDRTGPPSPLWPSRPAPPLRLSPVSGTCAHRPNLGARSTGPPGPRSRSASLTGLSIRFPLRRARASSVSMKVKGILFDMVRLLVYNK